MAAPVRSRDLRASIRELGFERGVVDTLERLLDEYAENRQQMRDLTRLMATCVDQIEKLAHIGHGLSNVIDRMQRAHEQGENDADGRP